MGLVAARQTARYAPATWAEPDLLTCQIRKRWPRLRALRERRGLSLRQIAFPGCSPSYLSRVESGDRVASLTILAELARRLDTSIEELLGRSLDGRVSEADLAAAEVAARLGDPRAGADLESLLAGRTLAGRQARREPARSSTSACSPSTGATTRGPCDLLEQARACGPAPSARERPALYRALGRAHAGTGDLIQAAAVLQAAFDEVCEAPADAALMVQFGSYLANAYTDRGRFSDAEQVLSRVLRHEREIDGANLLRLDWALARTYAEQGQSRVAEMYAHRVLARMERGEELRAQGHAHLLIAGVLLDQGQAGAAAARISTRPSGCSPTRPPSSSRS